MDKINFTAKDNFPLSADSMELLQRMINLSAKPALLGGSDYILSGCSDDGNGNISAGILVINGELAGFAGGAKKAKIKIQQTSQTLNAFGVDYPEAYIFRNAVFSDTEGYDWPGFSQAPTSLQLQQRIDGIRGDAPGTVKMWAGLIVKIPSDYRLCDGSKLPVGEFPELFDNIGAVFGGDGVNDFSLPDLRGRFVVGHSSGLNDYNAVGNTGGDEKVTLSANQIPPHTHTTRLKYAGVDDTDNANYHALVTDGSSGNTYSVESQPAGEGTGHENRPPFFVLAYIIKVK
jgi:microcystin-dependent protein